MGKTRLSCIPSGKCSCRHPCYFLFIPSLYLPSLGDGGGKTTCSVDAGSSDLYLEGSWWLFLLSLPLSRNHTPGTTTGMGKIQSNPGSSVQGHPQESMSRGERAGGRDHS